MSRPWTAEIDVDRDRARALIRARAPAVRADRVEPFGAGWDNTAFLVDGELVVRFPRRPSAVPLLRTEAAVLAALAGRLPLSIPVPVFHAADGPDFPWPFLGYRLLPGRTLCSARLTAVQRRAIAPRLGAFLATLHALPADDLPLPPDTLGRLELDRRSAELEERLSVLAVRGIVADPEPWLERFAHLGPDPVDPRADTIVHGDIYARHLVVDATGRLTGVIDWGDIHRGDAAVDLMAAFTLLPASARPAFFRAYGPIDPAVGSAARRRALFHAVAVTWYGAEQGDADLLREGRRALDHVLDD